MSFLNPSIIYRRYEHTELVKFKKDYFIILKWHWVLLDFRVIGLIEDVIVDLHQAVHQLISGVVLAAYINDRLFWYFCCALLEPCHLLLHLLPFLLEKIFIFISSYLNSKIFPFDIEPLFWSIHYDNINIFINISFVKSSMATISFAIAIIGAAIELFGFLK